MSNGHAEGTQRITASTPSRPQSVSGLRTQFDPAKSAPRFVSYTFDMLDDIFGELSRDDYFLPLAAILAVIIINRLASETR